MFNLKQREKEREREQKDLFFLFCWVVVLGGMNRSKARRVWSTAPVFVVYVCQPSLSLSLFSLSGCEFVRLLQFLQLPLLSLSLLTNDFGSHLFHIVGIFFHFHYYFLCALLCILVYLQLHLPSKVPHPISTRF